MALLVYGANGYTGELVAPSLRWCQSWRESTPPSAVAMSWGSGASTSRITVPQQVWESTAWNWTDDS